MLSSLLQDVEEQATRLGYLTPFKRYKSLFLYLELTTVSDNDGAASSSALRTNSFHGLDHIHAIHHLAEHTVLAIQPRSISSAGIKKLDLIGKSLKGNLPDKELAAVGFDITEN